MFNFVQENQSLTMILLISSVVLLIWVVYLQIRLVLLNKKNREMFQGVKVDNLEELLLKQVKQVNQNASDIQKLSQFAQKISDTTDICIKKVVLMRFNPFDDTGGDQSFALALLDSFDNGVVISSLHSREGTRVYAKPIAKGQTKYHLSDEEKTVLQKAMGQK